MNNLKARILKLLFLFAKKSYKKEHLRKTGNDIKCPNCKEWFSISGIQYEHKYQGREYGCSCTCGQCGYVSNWNLEAFPFPTLCDEKGNPI